MNPVIRKVTPDAVSLDELRPADCFERCETPGWVYMLTDMNTGTDGTYYIVNLNSGEFHKTKQDEYVFPIKSRQVKVSYDFEREFESERQE